MMTRHRRFSLEAFCLTYSFFWFCTMILTNFPHDLGPAPCLDVSNSWVVTCRCFW